MLRQKNIVSYEYYLKYHIPPSRPENDTGNCLGIYIMRGDTENNLPTVWLSLCIFENIALQFSLYVRVVFGSRTGDRKPFHFAQMHRISYPESPDTPLYQGIRSQKLE